MQYLSFDVLSGGAFNVTPSQNETLPPDISLTLSTPGINASLHFLTSFNWTGTTPETPYLELEGLDRSALFLTSAPDNSTSVLSNVLSAIQGPGSSIADQTSFLSYSDKFLAGGWRFLTYFGRDTLLALRLLLPVISPTAAEAILGAVIERTNDTGTICHEETIGDYASFVNIQNNQSELGNTPYYNYVMLDTDFLLLPVLADYFLTTPQGANRSEAFLARDSPLKNGTFQELLIKNVNHVLNLSKPFAEDPRKENLVPIRDPVVGNWRDSSSGLGYGIYPFDVESELCSADVRADRISRTHPRRTPRNRHARVGQYPPGKLLQRQCLRRCVGDQCLTALRSEHCVGQRHVVPQQLCAKSESVRGAPVRWRQFERLGQLEQQYRSGMERNVPAYRRQRDIHVLRLVAKGRLQSRRGGFNETRSPS